jgi:CheY-like chemotaxis protein
VTVDAEGKHMSTPSEILVVDADVSSLTGLLSLLRNLGYRTTGAADIVGACALIDAFSFDMLITDVRLHDESSLKLMRHARRVRPAIAIVAISGHVDTTAERYIEQIHATYMRKPLDVARFREILTQGVASGRRQRQWTRKPVTGGFPANLDGTAAKIVDMSYGGCRLEMSVPPDPLQRARVCMNLLPFGFAVNAELKWITRSEPMGPWNCGAAVSEMDSSIERAWRGVVDALPESSSL